jgi:hypothetical protein
VISVETSPKRLEPVRFSSFSTGRTHRVNGSPEPIGAVFPVVHTPYDFYERI